ncbi:radical SAM domain protein, partial [gut metagenome]
TDMAELAAITKNLHFHLEQVQDFTPTPMTLATEMYYTGYHPYTLEKVYTAHTKEQKLAQRQFFFWYKPETRRQIIRELNRIGRKDLIEKLFGKEGFSPAPRQNISRYDRHRYKRENMEQHRRKG